MTGWKMLMYARLLWKLAGKDAVDIWLRDWEHEADPETENRLTPHGKAQIRRICARLRRRLDMPRKEKQDEDLRS